MKVLGINFGGRPMERCEIMVKEALFAAKEAGAEVEFVRTVGMNIGHCRGCGVCTDKRDSGSNVHCIFEDDYQKIEEKILDADGVIVASPVFSIGTSGQMKNYIDRFGAAHDLAACEMENKKRIEAGKTGDELLDPRYFKKRYVAYISVGGASTPHWASLGLPTMTEFGTSMYAKVVGQINGYGQGMKVSPLFDDELMAECANLGKKVVESYGKDYEDVKWNGEEGSCPLCHGNVILMNGTDKVNCASCGLPLTMHVEGGKVTYTHDKADEKYSRVTKEGLYDHYWEIEGMKEVAIPKVIANKDWLEEHKAKYKNFDEEIKKVK
ncbi:MAG: flavodoxin family protein [Lachnospiraceae bacterium]|jgi:multimeric flavodoxin WrbA|nr:flavodoxin family protein [Lachnospiraceae bacterium]